MYINCLFDGKRRNHLAFLGSALKMSFSSSVVFTVFLRHQIHTFVIVLFSRKLSFVKHISFLF